MLDKGFFSAHSLCLEIPEEPRVGAGTATEVSVWAEVTLSTGAVVCPEPTCGVAVDKVSDTPRSAQLPAAAHSHFLSLAPGGAARMIRTRAFTALAGLCLLTGRQYRRLCHDALRVCGPVAPVCDIPDNGPD